MRRALLVVALGLLTVVGCRKKLAEGTCRIDIDCKAGFDCKEGKCTERPRPPWEQQAATGAATGGGEAKPGAAQPAGRPAPGVQQPGVRQPTPAGAVPGYPKPGQRVRQDPRVFAPDA